MAESNLQDSSAFPSDDSLLRIPCPHCGADPARRPCEVTQDIINGTVFRLSFRCSICGQQPAVLCIPAFRKQLERAGVHGPDALREVGVPVDSRCLLSWQPGTAVLTDALVIHNL